MRVNHRGLKPPRPHSALHGASELLAVRRTCHVRWCESLTFQLSALVEAGHLTPRGRRPLGARLSVCQPAPSSALPVRLLNSSATRTLKGERLIWRKINDVKLLQLHMEKCSSEWSG
ncbi:unnamed protein product [Pleuronectes platessa]|uniref:Uncharacterized protein n=1 Tax=Pleuronectes platessa TaxID=8262 RepID=A0A9N7YKL4_PLEPL|nr:unnamed protein product [Pleuronectes platessa]